MRERGGGGRGGGRRFTLAVAALIARQIATWVKLLVAPAIVVVEILRAVGARD